MKLHTVANELDETILRGRSESGLEIFLNPRPDWVRTYAALGTNFGSIDRIGGADGEPVPSGLAHFLEHKLFEDAKGDVSDRFARIGASTNAMTGFMGTTYIVSTVGRENECLDLLLDFVQQPYFTDELVDKEQGIIAQEIRMYDDDPDWRIFFGLLQCLYARHPVRDNIAGTVASIADIDAATLQRCYKLFYHPKNLCLAVSGSFDPEAVASLVDADQAPRSNGLGRHVRAAVEEPVARHTEMYEERLPVSRPRLLMGIKETVLGGEQRDVVLRELTTRILLDVLFGRSSRAFEELYAEGLIDETFGVSHTAEAGFGFSTIGGDTDEPERLAERVHAVFDRARRSGLDKQAHARIRKKVLGGMLRGLDSLEHVAHGLISDLFRGLPPFGALELVEAIGLDDLAARLEEHVRDDAFATAVVQPDGSL